MEKATSKGRLQYNTAWCKDCGICAAFCPKGILIMVHGKLVIENESDCAGCNMCGRLCPDYAIFFGEEDAQ